MNKRQVLDVAISQLRACIGNGIYNVSSKYNAECYGKPVKNIALTALNKTGGDKYIKECIEVISFDFLNYSELEASFLGSQKYEKEINDKYKQNIQEIISILEAHRDTIKLQNNDKIQKWALVCSFIAAIISIISLLLNDKVIDFFVAFVKK